MKRNKRNDSTSGDLKSNDEQSNVLYIRNKGEDDKKPNKEDKRPNKEENQGLLSNLDPYKNFNALLPRLKVKSLVF